MIKDEMVEVERSDKILSFFRNLLRKKSKILLWQNIDNIHRIKFYAHYYRLDLKKGELTFLPKKGGFKFDSRLPLYFYSEKRTALFKNNIYFNSSRNIAVLIPDFLMLKNLRNKSRIQGVGDMVEVHLKKDNFTNLSQYKFPLIDRSEDGLAFRSSLNNVIRFKEGQHLEFKFETMNSYRLGKIVAITQVIEGKLKYNRISVKKA